MLAGRLADYWPEPASGVREWLAFEDHYLKHVVSRQEWNAIISRGDYAEKADDFIARALYSSHLQWFAEQNGSVTIYDRQRNELTVLDAEGNIVTYFRPRPVQEYYERKLAEQLAGGFVIAWGGPPT